MIPREWGVIISQPSRRKREMTVILIHNSTCRRHVDGRVAGCADALCGAGHDDGAGQQGGVPARPRHDLLAAEYHVRRVRVLGSNSIGLKNQL